jgi:hypothetical protein
MKNIYRVHSFVENDPFFSFKLMTFQSLQIMDKIDWNEKLSNLRSLG